MWIVTTDGFFSAVCNKFCVPGEIAVRARRVEDIERFRAATGTKAEVMVFPRADYRYRVQVPVDVWAGYLSSMAHAVNYGNFKNEIAKREDRDLLHVLHHVWEDFYQLQR